MALQRKKKYKACPPRETIDRIKAILSKVGIEIREVIHDGEFFHSAHLHIANEGLSVFNLIVNGKGMTSDYALASAYGELMERIQSGILFPFKSFASNVFADYLRGNHFKGCGLSYAMAPDEKIETSPEEIAAVINNYVVTYDNESVINSYHYKFEIELPFYNVSEDKIDYIPRRILEHSCASNGMSAGNTPHEAILQGICEIFERYALRLIYNEKLTPPTIPLIMFEEDRLYSIVTELESALNVRICIKDCSCGIGLPVIGVLILDEKNCKYQFHLGADPSPLVALERTLTELHQGKTSINLIDIDVPRQLAIIEDVKIREDERLNYSFGKNRMPLSIFYETPSYEFMGFDDRWGESDKRDLSLAVALIGKLGFKLFVRDVSYLGFPSYIVYIPGMSEQTDIDSLRWFNATFEKNDRITFLSHSLIKASDQEIIEFLKLEEGFKAPAYLDFCNSGDVWCHGNQNFVLGVLAASVKQWDTSLKYLQAAKERLSDHSSLKGLYHCFYDYAYLESKSLDARNILSGIYSEQLLEVVRKCIEEKYWRHLFNLTDCFNCDECQLKASCSFHSYILLLKRLEEQYKVHCPMQEKMKLLFDFTDER